MDALTEKNSHTPKIYLDDKEAREAKAKRRRRHHVVSIPQLRLVGFSMLAFGVFLYNHYVRGIADLGYLWFFLAATYIYVLGSWAVLLLWFEKSTRFNLGAFFLGMDNLVIVLAIYLTGAEQSVLFFLLCAKVADQAHTYFKRALLYSHLAISFYVLMLIYVVAVDGRAINLHLEAFKVLAMYLFNLYISLTTLTAERIAQRTRSIVRLARGLIEQLREKNDQLERSRTQAERANRAKTDFLANISHEIRTPMNTIMGMTELTLETTLTEQQKSFIEAVKASSDHLLILINDLLDISKIEEDRLSIRMGPFNLREAVDPVIKGAKYNAERKGLDLDYRFEESTTPWVIGDRARLRQVLTNLIDNAIKYTESGSVRVRIVSEEKPDSSLRTTFTVSDTGIGISPEHQERIFEPFIQVDSSTTRKYPGAGLGLAISHRLVSLMGGRLWVHSQPGQGTTFGFALNLAQADTQSLDHQKAGRAGSDGGDGAMRPLSILCVEDDPNNQMVITEAIKFIGHRVTIAGSGQEALALFKAHKYDLVLMDIHMPGMDGFQASKAMREMEAASGGHTPIIAVTGSALPGFDQVCSDAGMDGYMSKPYSIEVLRQKVADYL